MLGFDFIRYDVREQLLEDPHIQGLSFENLIQIFTTRRITSYYPIRTLSFAVDFQVWGQNPAGFKLTNGLIHLANVLLVFWLGIRLLGSPFAVEQANSRWAAVCAGLAAAVYAVHPVVVEPVVWIAGREELLMALGALGCLHFHLAARELGEGPEQSKQVDARYVGSAICCAFACLSNAVAAILPMLIVVWDLLMLSGAKQQRIVRGTLALWLIAAATIVIKVLDPLSPEMDKGNFLANDRALLVMNVYWLNLKSLVWPAELALRYSKVEPQGITSAEVVLGFFAAVATCVVMWRLRKRRIALYGLLWFVLSLAPAAQVMPHHLHRADRFLYLPLIGLTVVLASATAFVAGRINRRWQLYVAVIAGMCVILALQITSAQQLTTWRNDISMWKNCLRVEPDSAVLHAALGHSLERAERFSEAGAAYEAAVVADSSDVQAHKYFALFLAQCPDEDQRDYSRAVELAKRAAQLSDDPTTAIVLTQVYANAGDVEMAIATADDAIEAARTAGNLMLEAEFRGLRQKILGEEAP